MHLLSHEDLLPMEQGITIASDEAVRLPVPARHKRSMSETTERDVLCACGARKRKARQASGGGEQCRGGHPALLMGPGFPRDWRRMRSHNTVDFPACGFSADGAGRGACPLWQSAMASLGDRAGSSMAASNDGSFSIGCVGDGDDGLSISSVSHSEVCKIGQLLWSAGSVGSAGSGSVAGAIRTQDALDASKSVQELASSTLSAQEPWVPGMDVSEGVCAGLSPEEEETAGESEAVPSQLLRASSCDVEQGNGTELLASGDQAGKLAWEQWTTGEGAPRACSEGVASIDGRVGGVEAESSVGEGGSSCEIEHDEISLWASGNGPVKLTWETWMSHDEALGRCSMSLSSRNGNERGSVQGVGDGLDSDGDERKINSIELWMPPLESGDVDKTVDPGGKGVLQKVDNDSRKQPHAMFQLGKATGCVAEFDPVVPNLLHGQGDGGQVEVLSTREDPKPFMVSILSAGVCDEEEAGLEPLQNVDVGNDRVTAGTALGRDGGSVNGGSVDGHAVSVKVPTLGKEASGHRGGGGIAGRTVAVRGMLFEEQGSGPEQWGLDNAAVAEPTLLTRGRQAHQAEWQPARDFKDGGEDSPSSLAEQCQMEQFGNARSRGLMGFVWQGIESRPDWGAEEDEVLTARDLVTCDSVTAELRGTRSEGRQNQWESINLSGPTFYCDSDNIESKGSSADGMEGQMVRYRGGFVSSPFLASNCREDSGDYGVSDESDEFHTPKSYQSDSFPPGGGAPPDRAEPFVESTSWEQLQEATIVSKAMKRVLSMNLGEGTEVEDDCPKPQAQSTGSTLAPSDVDPHHRRSSTGSSFEEGMDEAIMLSGGTVKGLSSDSDQDGEQDAPMWNVGSRGLATLDAGTPKWRETGDLEVVPISDFLGVRGGFASRRGDPLESLLDCPSVVGHKRLQTVLEESTTSEDMLSDDNSDPGPTQGGEQGEGWVFDRAGQTLTGSQDEWEGELSLTGPQDSGIVAGGMFSPDFRRSGLQRSKSDFVTGGSQSALGGEPDGLLALTEEDRCKSAPCDLSGVFDGFSGNDSEVSEFFGRPASAMDGVTEPIDRPDSRMSDPGLGSASRHKRRRSRGASSPNLLRWLRTKLNFKTSVDVSSDGTPIGSFSERLSSFGRRSGSFRTASAKDSEAISSISLSDMVAALNTPPADGEEVYNVILNTDIYDPIEYGPEGPKQLYSLMRPKLRSLKVDVDKWDAMSCQPVPVIEFYDSIVQEAEDLGIDLFNIMEEVAGKNNSLMLSIKECLGRAPYRGCSSSSCSELAKPYDRELGQWRVEVDSGMEGPDDLSGQKAKHSMDVLDVLSECGINAMFFDRC
ncbi:unnamed protein product [Ostreobium quekettii]|uniref:Uncharacterized protein n=1 Tax=Ostreobium quekettii TaxID=121088 RepID=A0A8S1J338_9CHLO|nr:unnamed protein product [Ostreobium quekettii]